ncbi:g-type lectin s-receptor-like serine/threonine-protein kinase b120 [Quercus suber]|uniref:G-type lectin s-receptor-like serine/threonine-protein kinase b120 n=1 Tax=Quercus suber TaxID=58331 RepID=A0AAW0KSV3_QUESU
MSIATKEMVRLFCVEITHKLKVYGSRICNEGVFSVKSDVFSFDVILLEIISGKRNSDIYLTEHTQTLFTYENPQDRPTM